ncbi:MAG TPA: geranylgeranylglycerol-phosphate geranylgeranyltransferase [Candidatus Norongarragalinales archaeon]|nr:geranylgeranylglycerol-phosphate geranylgeranyltransferase [Candidatus Norongarragalinales archaeon]
MKGTLSDWLKLSRIEHAFMVAVAIIISEALAAKYSGLPFSPFSMGAIYPVLGPFLITAAAFMLNDYFGFETDKSNKRQDRPLVAKKIERKDALRASVFLYALGLLLAFYVNIYCFTIALFFVFLSAIYDSFLKMKPLLGNAYIASSMAISFIYGNFAVSNDLQDITLLFAAISFLAGMGRELIITLRDVKGDRKIGARTLPMILGKRYTLQLSSVFFIAAIILSWVPINGKYFTAYAFLIAVNNFLLIWCIFLLFGKSADAFKKARDLSLLALMVGLAAFATLAI